MSWYCLASVLIIWMHFFLVIMRISLTVFIICHLFACWVCSCDYLSAFTSMGRVLVSQYCRLLFSHFHWTPWTSFLSTLFVILVWIVLIYSILVAIKMNFAWIFWMIFCNCFKNSNNWSFLVVFNQLFILWFLIGFIGFV
jgi:hypothetical protein